MITVLDVETTFTKDGDPTPFHPDNRLVSVGINDEYFFFYHKDMKDMKKIQESKKRIQEILNDSTLIVGHNLKFDMSWMYEFGFTYNGKLYDTMLAEYVMNRGVKNKSISLKESCKRRGLSVKSDILASYIDSGYGVDEIPMEKLEEYGKQDVAITKQLYLTQVRLFNQPGNNILKPTLNLMNDFLRVLIDMECNGNYIDLTELDVVEKELNEEYVKLKSKINRVIQQFMGDTPINLSSTEDLSKVIYSRKVQDKNTWATLFNIGVDKNSGKQKRRPKISEKDFQQLDLNHTDQVYKTVAQQCGTCSGVGYIRKQNKDGKPSKMLNICPKCKKEGMLYIQTQAPAGFNYKSRTVNDASQGGFKTDKETLTRISATSDGALKDFVDSIIRYSAIETYLNTFVTGIRATLPSSL